LNSSKFNVLKKKNKKVGGEREREGGKKRGKGGGRERLERQTD
jgi:hypothetical protein